jgi:MOSC domain-containing protein YiiM
MNRVVSVNVGLPKEVNWNGKRIRTAIWKRPVAGRVQVHKSNLEGDGQADLAGHGGVHRAVMVYQMESYRYWVDSNSISDTVAVTGWREGFIGCQFPMVAA